MRPSAHLAFVLLALSALVACLPLPPASGMATAVPSSVPLTLERLRNSAYQVLFPDGSLRTIPLTDGVYRPDPQASPGGDVLAQLGEQVAWGDLNNDGLEDAVVTLVLDFGNARTLTALVPWLNQNGMAIQPAPAFLEDLPVLHSLTIEDGEITLQATTHGVGDHPCCPSQEVSKAYRLLGNRLWLTHLTSRATATAPVRVITIESPADNARVTIPLTVTGRVTVAPFESTLVYKILTADGEVLAQGPLMVEAPEMGAPGTFTLTLGADAPALHGPVRVEFWDFSPADGSPLAMAAIYLVIE